MFDGCHPDFRIVVAPQLYNIFTTDANWSRYADRIVASDYMPTKYDPITVDGVTYDYAANSLNTLPTSELTRLQSSWWNAAIIGVEVAIAVATWGTANAATTSAQTTAQAAVNTAQAALNKATETILTEGSKFITTVSDMMVNSGLPLKGFSGMMFTPSATALSNFSLASATLTAKEAALAAAMSNYTYYMMAAGISAGSAAGINGLNYVANTVGKKTRREPTWAMQGQWLLTECKHTIYHMYVKDVANKETVTVYNDIGSAYNYKTVAIGRDAFRGKDKIKTIRFQDLYDDASEMYANMTVTIPDSAFMGCTGLETLDLIMRSIDTNPDRDVALGPENFILCGEDIFAGCDTTKLKIRIGAEKYEEFAENPVWGKYKNCFEVVDVPEVVDFTEYGAQYSYSFENNALKKQGYTGGHTIEHLHVIGQDVDGLKNQKGEVGLFNDIGVYNNYKLDYVKEKAFYGSQELKGISMFDLKGAAGFGDSYTDLSLVLQDSAFANCPNLEYINMLYFRTDGTNSVEPMSPGRVQLGDGVFAGSDKFKVKMVTTAVDEFKADTAWAKYEDRFLPCYIQTGDPILADILEACGIEYESPITGGGFDIYDVMKVTDLAVLDDKFKSKKFEAFPDFKAFELINLTAVADSMFKNCGNMQGIELPSTMKSIGKYAFSNCALLDDIVIPDSVTEIKDRAFSGCASLRNITFLSKTPATLGADVFAEMPSDYVLYVPETSIRVYKAAWPQYASHIQSVTEKHTGIWNVTLTEPGTLAQKLGLTITGTDPLTISGNYSKYDSLKIVGPINGTDVGVIRFMGGRDVNNADVTLAGNLKYLDLYDAHIKAGGADYNQDGSNDRITEDDCIDTYMFWELDALETLILPKSVTKIKDYAFNNCNALRRLVIGDNTKSIGEEVTHDSPKLQEVIMLCNEVPATDGDAWAEEKTIKVFYVPNVIREHLSGSRVYYTRGDSISSPFVDDAVMHAMAGKRIYTISDIAGLTDFENVVNEVKVVTVTEPGTLGEALGFTVNMDSPNNVGRIGGDLISIKALKVNGPINGKDIAVLRMLGGRDEEDGDEVALARMTYLDLYDATICTDSNNICFNRDGKNDYVENDNEVPEHMFWKLDKLQTVILPKNVTKIDDNAFYDNIGIETIVVGDATTYIGNDAFGECKNLKNIIFLGNEKAELDGDAFTDPITDQPYKVEKMYIPLGLYRNYVADAEYTTHTKEFCTNFDDDDLFRAYGSRLVITTDQLQSVTNVDGWFDYHTGIKDLTSLELTAVDSLKNATLTPLTELEKITFPATLAVVENGAFAANTKLQWVDFAQCTNEGVITEENISNLGINEHALIYAPEYFTATGLTNVVYGSEGNLNCDHFTISDNAAYAVPREFNAAAISYDRQFKQGETTTLCLPFNMEIPVGARAFVLTDEVGDTMFVAQVKGMEANRPYIVMADEDVTFGTTNETLVPVAPDRLEQETTPNYALLGTFAPINAKDAEEQRMYILDENASWSLVKDAAEGEQVLSPYSVYMQTMKPNAPAAIMMREAVFNIVDGAYTEYENPKDKIGRIIYTRTLNNAWNALYVPFQIELTEEFLANYDVAYINDIHSYDRNDDGDIDDWDIEIVKIKKLAKLKANHPYVIRPKNDEAVNLNINQIYSTLHSTAPDNRIDIACSSVYKQYAVKGVYSKTKSGELDNGNYVYAINKKGEWQKMGLETSLVPFRIYLTVKNSDGSPVAVDEMPAQTIRMRVVGEEDENGTTVIYDVDVEEEQQGEDVIYDLQGRRVLEPKKGGIYIVNNKKVIF